MAAFGKVLRPLFGVSRKEATNFGEGDSAAAFRLETVVSTVTQGCHVTLQSSNFVTLVERMSEFEPELRGYAYEGAGVGLAALDCLLPLKNCTKDFINGPGSPYIYAVHIGAGLGLARMRRQPERFLSRLDPVLGWMALDGYGFHAGFFARQHYVKRHVVPKYLSPYGLRVFDHGIGRSIWFVVGANSEQIAATIAAFPEARQADLWSGIGLGCGYTGGVDLAELKRLQAVASSYKTPLAVGVAIAAHARRLAGSPATYAELACEVLCGVSCDEAALMVERAFLNLPIGGAKPAYEIWRQRLETHLAPLTESVIQSETHFVQQ